MLLLFEEGMISAERDQPHFLDSGSKKILIGKGEL